MLYQVKDLSPEQRHAAEILLCHPVSENEAVSIRSLDPSAIVPSKLSPDERLAALKALNERFARVSRPHVGDDEEEAAVNEALRSSRPDYRPVG